MKKIIKTIFVFILVIVLIGGIQYVWGGGIPLIDDLFTPTTTETVTTLDVTTDTVTTDIVTTENSVIQLPETTTTEQTNYL